MPAVPEFGVTVLQSFEKMSALRQASTPSTIAVVPTSEVFDLQAWVAFFSRPAKLPPALQLYTGKLHIDQPLEQQGGINVAPTGSMATASRWPGPRSR